MLPHQVRRVDPVAFACDKAMRSVLQSDELREEEFQAACRRVPEAAVG